MTVCLARVPHPKRTSRWLVPLLLCAAALLGCQAPDPVPTPTATRTPIVPTATPTSTPTPTATPTPTPTVTPSPTLPPGLVLPPTPVTIESCPPLPSDLAFLRDGDLWLCLAEGAAMDRIGVSPDAEGGAIVDFRIAPGGGRVAYLTDAGELWVLDRAERVHIRMPTSGRLLNDGRAYFDLADNGSTLIYLGWGVQATSGPAVASPEGGSLLSLSIDAPRRRQEILGFCAGTLVSPCRGFVLSPNETTLAMVDETGVWRIDRGAPEAPRLLGTTSNVKLQIRSWAPDGLWLLLEAPGSGGVPDLGLISTQAEDLPIVLSPTCPTGPCATGEAWAVSEEGRTYLWMTWDTGSVGCAGRVFPDPGQPLQGVALECLTASVPLHPRSPYAGDALLVLSADLAFLQGGLTDPVDGLYALRAGPVQDAENALEMELLPIALLPTGVGAADAPWTVLWADSGAAFVVSDAVERPVYLGTLTPPAFWEVRTLLEGARSLQWVVATP
jgi:hypothetical protein